MTSLLDLAAKVEALTGPCRETDAEIFRTIGLTELQEDHCKNWLRINGRTDLTRDRYIAAWAPTFTQSLDAAMTLVPPNVPWLSLVGLDRPVSPALALTAAALRARASIGEGQ